MLQQTSNSGTESEGTLSAQPHEYPATPVERPRTVGAVRAALPPRLRAAFDLALDDAAPEELFSLVARWAAVAQTAGDPELDAAAQHVRDGGAVHDLVDVFPALADAG